MAAPLIGLVAIDVFVLLAGYVLYRNQPTGPLHVLSSKIIMYGHFLFVVPAFWTVLLAARLGSKGFINAACSLALWYLIMTRYRGPWAWQGTFDWYQQSQAPWLWPSVIGVFLGGLWVLFTRLKSNQSMQPPSDVKFIIGLAGACIASLAACFIWPISSFIAPKLHLALGTSAIVLTSLWFSFVREGGVQ